jgi:hypothetical protein
MAYEDREAQIGTLESSIKPTKVVITFRNGKMPFIVGWANPTVSSMGAVESIEVE